MRKFLAMGKQCRVVVNAVVMSVMLALAVGCSGGGESGGGTPAPASPAAGKVTGQVVSLANSSPVSGATVKTEAGTTTTAADGKFSLPAPTGDRTIVHVEANGFAEAFPVARVTAGQTTNLGVKLVPIGVTETVSVPAGGTVSVPNSPARVTIPANGLVPAGGGTPTGSVNVSLTPINPAVEPSVMPGGFNGIAAGGGSVQPIESGGALLLDIRDSTGTRYNFAQGTTATIRIPLGTQSANPPATMPLWFFDETAGVWREDGIATLQGTGSNRYYEGTVARVTYWNADLVLESIVVTGCVKDANGQAVANALVQTEGIDYTGVAQDSTAADGTFSVAMRRNSQTNLRVVDYDSQTFNLVSLSNLVKVGPSATDINLPNCLVKQPGPLAITTTALPGSTVGVSYNQTLAASGGVPGYVWDLNGSNTLPAGLTLNPSGVISGTPTAAGSTTIMVKVTDSTGAAATKEFTLTVIGQNVPPLLAISTSSLSGGTVGLAYNAQLAATGGTGAKSWSVNSGTLPAGLSLDASTGVISGTPTAPGASTFTIQVLDSGTPQQSAQQQFVIAIIPSGGGGTGGGGGTLTVTGAPASIGGMFVADEGLTLTSPVGLVWHEPEGSPLRRIEQVSIIFLPTTGQMYSVLFVEEDPNDRIWACIEASFPESSSAVCSGVTVDRVAGTVTFTNTVLMYSSNDDEDLPPITLNGTLTFKPS